MARNIILEIPLKDIVVILNQNSQLCMRALIKVSTIGEYQVQPYTVPSVQGL